MLKKLVAIKNVGTFRNSGALGNTDLRRFTLVHAENGRGKTTLCAILRSLQSGDANLILERTTLDGDAPPLVEVLADAGKIVFKDGKWASTCQHIEIFDAYFVADNVYSGDSITHDHKKNLCRVVLGAQGVKLAKRFDDLDALVRTVNGELGAAKEALQKLAPKGLSVESFLALPPDPDIDNNIRAKKAELAVLNDAAAIRQKPGLGDVELPQPPSSLTATLSKTIDGVSADAERLVRQHVAAHNMAGRGEAWLAEGLRYTANDDCPFCDQPLATSPVIGLFRAFFSDAYRSFQQELNRFESAVHEPLSNAALLVAQKQVGDNAALAEFWRKYVSEGPPQISFEDAIQPTIRKLREALDPLVRKKVASPLEPVSYSHEANAAIEAWKRLRDEVQSYNERVAAFNRSVGAVKAAALGSKTPAAVQAEVSALEAKRVRYEPGTIDAVKAYAEAKAKKASAEAEKAKAKSELDTYNATVIDKYRDTVNRLLYHFGAAFRLAKVKVEYTGRTPRTAYSFEIRGKEVDPGGDNTPAGTASFRNTLSSGDRSTLALAFFIAQLKNRSDLRDLIVVFDDPFTSLDSFRQSWTCNAIRGLAREAKQVIVLSHALDFLRRVATGCDRSTLRTLQIDRHGRVDSRLIELDLDDATTSAVERDVVQLRSFYLGDDKDAAKTVRCIRPLLENHLRKMAPGQCPAGKGWLGDFLAGIRDADAASPLGVFKPLYEELDFLNGYTSPHAHDSGIAPDINPTELQNAVELTLKLLSRL